MKPGQVLTQWWQDFVAGKLRTAEDWARARAQFHPSDAKASDRFLEEPQDGFRWEAPRRLAAPGFFLSSGCLDQWEKADWRSVDARLARWSAVFIELARRRGVPLYVHCALRPEAEQEEAYLAGHSRARYPRSAHNIGEAVDIVHGIYHWTLTKQEWALLHVLGLRALDLVNAGRPKAERLVLTWGGTFAGLWDPAHWEISDFRARIRPWPDGVPVRMTPRYILRNLRV